MLNLSKRARFHVDASGYRYRTRLTTGCTRPRFRGKNSLRVKVAQRRLVSENLPANRLSSTQQNRAIERAIPGPDNPTLLHWNLVGELVLNSSETRQPSSTEASKLHSSSSSSSSCSLQVHSGARRKLSRDRRFSQTRAGAAPCRRERGAVPLFNNRGKAPASSCFVLCGSSRCLNEEEN